ncbi:MAG: rubrerythrin-like protein [Candidatus Acidoferrum typicum]|nr:rubrerythrin-like protein [Candidatus Acidoferrum typicum]
MTSLSKVFDPQTALLAKHAQHVVLVHFPIALFLTGVAFDWAGRWTRRKALAETAYYNLLVAAASTLPVLVTGLLAWQFQLEGQRLKGILLLHLVLGCTSSLLICAVWWLHFRARRRGAAVSGYLWVVEAAGVAVVGLTGHLGGFLAGVNVG